MSVSIRSAVQADVEKWMVLRCKFWPEMEPAELAGDIAPMLKDNRAWLAVESDVIIGFAEASVRSIGPSDPVELAYLEAIYVKPRHRRTDIAGQLLRAVESWARALGHDDLFSDTETDNLLGRKWHEGKAFTAVEELILWRKDI